MQKEKIMADMNALSEFLQKGRAKEVKELVQAALDEGVSAKIILEEGLMSGMSIIGVKFKNNEVFVPEVLIAARAMNAGTEILKPFLVDAGVVSKGTVILGTVKGDLHDIGKNLVGMMMEGKGLKIVDLGTDVTPKQFVEAAVSNNANIIACSALLTTTMTEMQNVVKEAVSAGIRDKVTIMIGGAPVTTSYCENIGADYYTADAASASEVAVEICQK
jgi:methylmalonyl-CoA mutase cobalamin-binding domain/chain